MKYVDKMTVDMMSVDEMTLEMTSVDKMTKTDVCR